MVRESQREKDIGVFKERIDEMARFRLENEMRKGKYWEERKNRFCRLCEKIEKEMWEHMGEM